MSLFLPDLQKFFLQATAEVVYWRCSLIKWIKSSLETAVKAVEVEDLEVRIAALEAAQEHR
jgi:hypothetical protein